MKKIGTMTFHWATNYGAVLQAYALQKILLLNGCDAELINYKPEKILKKEKLLFFIKLNIKHFKKEYNINKFRKKHLKYSKKCYNSFSSLCLYDYDYDAVFVGSDQIWNEWFTLNAEGGVTKSYFLDFLPIEIKRYSYAASIGSNSVNTKYLMETKDSFMKFEKISVREKTAVDILKKQEIDAELVLDPTLLINERIYLDIIKDVQYKQEAVFSYIIHVNQFDAIDISNYVKSMYKEVDLNYSPTFGVEEWLYSIKNSKIVVTNSFHGIVFSLIFNTPFIAILIDGSGMNDRIITLLKALNLENRIVIEFNECEVERICSTYIDWGKINENIDVMKKKSLDFILSCINDVGKRK